MIKEFSGQTTPRGGGGGGGTARYRFIGYGVQALSLGLNIKIREQLLDREEFGKFSLV